jgi:transglutaminase-like putative cysteine protease
VSGPGPHLCEPTEFLDHQSAAVRDFIDSVVGVRDGAQREQAVDLYYAVRDGVQYEVYGADFSRRGMRASSVLGRGRGLCIHKSVLYAACVRALAIPSRLVLVDVRNHLSSARLRALLGSEVFCYHCFTQLYLNGRWVKATPVFGAKLCRLYHLAPLEFDGRADAVLQAGDERGSSFIEVVHEHGEFDDLPYEHLIAGLRKAHGGIFAGPARTTRGSLLAEAGGSRCC